MIDKFKSTRRKKKPRKQYFTEKEWLEVEKIVPHLNLEEASIAEIIFSIENSITDFPACETCGESVDFDLKHNTYKSYCSKECKYDPVYGVRAKMKATSLKKYGVEDASIRPEALTKRKQTNLERRGVEVPAQDPKVREKMQATMEERHGVKFTAESSDLRLKMQATMEEKYGVKHALQNKEILDKMHQTLEERYGEYHALLNQELKDKMVRTTIDRHGVPYAMQSSELFEKYLESHKKAYWETFKSKLLMKGIVPEFSEEEYLGKRTDLTYKCTLCNKTFAADDCVQTTYCPFHRFKSRPEYEISNWLQEEFPELDIYSSYKEDRKELDVFIPELNLGIEYHGLFWHSSKPKNYHQEKCFFFADRGKRVIQIFENEWNLQKDIVKSIILRFAGKTERTLYARKCELKIVPASTQRIFLEANHLQGYAPGKIGVGLYYNGKLVQLMTFSKPRFNKNYTWENIRTCTLQGTTVVGGFSRILSNFEKNYPGSIISYIDLRYFTGKGYLENGFKLLKISPPNYFYFKKNSLTLESRIKYQKHKLEEELDIFDPKLSEEANMEANGFLRIFDAGNLVMVKCGG